MKTILVSEIDVSDRIRREFDQKAMWELAESISSKGLMHAPVLDNSGSKLVAGERRLRAINLLYEWGRTFRYDNCDVPVGEVPYITLADLAPDALLEAELEENLRRKALTPQEEAQAVARLHNLRGYETYSETASEVTELGRLVGPTDVRDDIQIAKHLDLPEVAKAKTKKEAVKAVRKHLERQHHEKLAQEFSVKTFDPSTSRHVLKLADFREVLPQMPDHCVDVIICDPPYGIDADVFGDMADNRHTYEDDLHTALELVRDIATQGFRIAKKEAHAYCFCAYETFEAFKRVWEQAGWLVWKRPLIWSKGASCGMLPHPKYGPRYTYECIVYALKGKKETTGIYADFIFEPGLQRPRRGAEKPWRLYEKLIRRSVKPGDHILDPTAGTGPVIPAADHRKCLVTAIERDPAAFGMLTERLNGEPQELAEPLENIL